MSTRKGTRNASADASAGLVDFCRVQYDRLVGLLSLYCGDASEAEDLAQEALVRVWARWDRISGFDDPAAWVTRVAMNLANSRFRRLAVRRRLANKVEAINQARSSDHSDPADVLAVRRAIGRLPIRQKTALVLRYYEDLSVADVAQRMRCPEGTVKTLTREAIAALRRSGLEVSDE